MLAIIAQYIIPVAITAAVTAIVTRFTIKNEMYKMRAAWDHEEKVTIEHQYGEMAAAVSKFISYPSQTNQSKALDSVELLRMKEYGYMGNLLDNLHSQIVRECSNTITPAVENALAKVVEERRKLIKQS